MNCLLLTIGLPVKTTVTGNGSFDLKALRHSGDLVRIGVLMKSKMPGFMDLLLFSTLLGKNCSQRSSFKDFVHAHDICADFE